MFLFLKILSKVASAGQSWKEALLSTLPERKGAREIGEDQEDELDSSQENSQDGSINDNSNDDISQNLEQPKAIPNI